ncbi:MAG: NADP-dependent 3-hydroxy acid dehydrogenase YdfG, partial [Thermoproteota archaeon]
MKYVLVTGTGSGIGLSTVQKLKKDGYFVFANGKSETDLILWKDTENVYPILFDVRDKEAT